MGGTMRMLHEIVRELAAQGPLPEELRTVELEREMVIQDLGIDSLGLTALITEIEDRVGFAMPDDAFERFRRLGDLVDFVERAGRG